MVAPNTSSTSNVKVNLRRDLLDKIDEVLQSAPIEMMFESRDQIVQMAVLEWLERWSLASYLKSVPRPQICHACQEIIHLVPIAEAAGVTFMLHGHRTECPLHSTAPPQEEQARKAGFGDGVRWDEFFQSKRLHHIEIREDLERRERQLKLEKKAKAMVKRRDREAPP